MKKIHDSLYILHKCYWNTQVAWKAIDEHQQKGPLFSVHHFTKNLTHYLILETVSFLEEYKKQFIPNKVEEIYKERVIMVRKICKPVFQQIDKWSGLNKFRDNFIAHPWRDEDKLVVPLNKKYQIPRTWIEFRFLKDLVSYMHNIIAAEFKKEMDFALFFGDELNEEVAALFTMDQINEEVKSLFEKSTSLMKEYDKDYDVQFFTYSP
ncbi:MAG: hypothetical protein QM737_18615 [Ferruginibacter sp.]